jgi:hypothetical protein
MAYNLSARTNYYEFSAASVLAYELYYRQLNDIQPRFDTIGNNVEAKRRAYSSLAASIYGYSIPLTFKNQNDKQFEVSRLFKSGDIKLNVTYIPAYESSIYTIPYYGQYKQPQSENDIRFSITESSTSTLQQQSKTETTSDYYSYITVDPEMPWIVSKDIQTIDLFYQYNTVTEKRVFRAQTPPLTSNIYIDGIKYNLSDIGYDFTQWIQPGAYSQAPLPWVFKLPKYYTGETYLKINTVPTGHIRSDSISRPPGSFSPGVQTFNISIDPISANVVVSDKDIYTPNRPIVDIETTYKQNDRWSSLTTKVKANVIDGTTLYWNANLYGFYGGFEPSQGTVVIKNGIGTFTTEYTNPYINPGHWTLKPIYPSPPVQEIRIFEDSAFTLNVKRPVETSSGYTFFINNHPLTPGKDYTPITPHNSKKIKIVPKVRGSLHIKEATKSTSLTGNSNVITIDTTGLLITTTTPAPTTTPRPINFNIVNTYGQFGAIKGSKNEVFQDGSRYLLTVFTGAGTVVDPSFYTVSQYSVEFIKSITSQVYITIKDTVFNTTNTSDVISIVLPNGQINTTTPLPDSFNISSNNSELIASIPIRQEQFLPTDSSGNIVYGTYPLGVKLVVFKDNNIISTALYTITDTFKIRFNQAITGAFKFTVYADIPLVDKAGILYKEKGTYTSNTIYINYNPQGPSQATTPSSNLTLASWGVGYPTLPNTRVTFPLTFANGLLSSSQQLRGVIGDIEEAEMQYPNIYRKYGDPEFMFRGSDPANNSLSYIKWQDYGAWINKNSFKFTKPIKGDIKLSTYQLETIWYNGKTNTYINPTDAATDPKFKVFQTDTKVQYLSEALYIDYTPPDTRERDYPATSDFKIGLYYVPPIFTNAQYPTGQDMLYITSTESLCGYRRLDANTSEDIPINVTLFKDNIEVSNEDYKYSPWSSNMLHINSDLYGSGKLFLRLNAAGSTPIYSNVIDLTGNPGGVDSFINISLSSDNRTILFNNFTPRGNKIIGWLDLKFNYEQSIYTGLRINNTQPPLSAVTFIQRDDIYGVRFNLPPLTDAIIRAVAKIYTFPDFTGSTTQPRYINDGYSEYINAWSNYSFYSNTLSGYNSIITTTTTTTTTLRPTLISDPNIINGSRDQSSFGEVISLNGSGYRVAASTSKFETGNTFVEVYEATSGDNFDLIGQRIPGTPGVKFGSSLSLDSSTGSNLLVGVSTSNRVLSYKLLNNEWLQSNSLYVGEGYESFGKSVKQSYDGLQAIIGGLDLITSTALGRVLTRDSLEDDWYTLSAFEITGTGSLHQNLTASGDGIEVDIAIAGNGNTVALGTTMKDGRVGDGVVRVFEQIDSVWNKKGNDIINFHRSDDTVITTKVFVELNQYGNKLLVGYSSGQVRAYTYDSLFGWEQSGDSITLEKDDRIVALTMNSNGDKFAITIRKQINEFNNPTSSSIAIYSFNGTTWQLAADRIISNSGLFGASVKFNSTGTVLAVGTPKGTGTVSLYNINYNTRGITTEAETTTTAPSTTINASVVTRATTTTRSPAARVSTITIAGDAVEIDDSINIDVLAAADEQSKDIVELNSIQNRINASLRNTNKIQRFVERSIGDVLLKEGTDAIIKEIETFLQSGEVGDNTINRLAILQQIINQQRGVTGLPAISNTPTSTSDVDLVDDSSSRAAALSEILRKSYLFYISNNLKKS